MKSYVYTQVYAIIQSNKGWKELFAIYFNKEKAERKLETLLQIPKEARNNFRLETWTCEDAIIFRTEEE